MTEITEADYLAAKAIVEAYEIQQQEENQRQAEEDLEDAELGSCEFCGYSDEEGHIFECPNNNNPFVLLCKEGYD